MFGAMRSPTGADAILHFSSIDREDDHGEEVDEEGNQEESRSGTQEEENNKSSGNAKHQEDRKEGGAEAPAESQEGRGPNACAGARTALAVSLRHG
jgi:hypothetical protein